jgi:hypothetical protein
MNVVAQNMESYQRVRQSLDMLRLVARGKKQVSEGKTRPADKVFATIEKKLGI